MSRDFACNGTTITMIQDQAESLTYAVIFSCIMIVGLPLNAVSLWILIRRHSLKSPSTVLMVNLAMSDLLLVFSLPMRIYFYATGSWPLTQLACLSATMLYRNNIRTSCLFITFISVDRLLAVVYPLRSRHLRTSSNTWKAAALGWLIVLVVNIPESVVFAEKRKNCSTFSCFEVSACDTQAWAVVVFYAAFVLLLLMVNVVCTVLVSWTLHGHLKNSVMVNKKVNVMLIFIMNLVVFIVCFIPVTVSTLTTDQRFIYSSSCLATVNCCLDPLLYYFSLDAFWKKKDDADLAGEE